jgi:hypothetical protein
VNLSFIPSLFVHETEGILCKKIPVNGMRPYPASSSAEIPVGTTRTPAPESGLFFPEPYENRIAGVPPDTAERLVSDIPYQKILRTGKLAGVNITMRIDICNSGSCTASAF